MQKQGISKFCFLTSISLPFAMFYSHSLPPQRRHSSALFISPRTPFSPSFSRTQYNSNTPCTVALFNTLRTGLLNCLNARSRALNFKHRASGIKGQTFRYSPENAFYIFNQQIYFII